MNGWGKIRVSSRFGTDWALGFLLVLVCVLFGEIALRGQNSTTLSLWYPVSGLIFAFLYGVRARYVTIVFLAIVLIERPHNPSAPTPLLLLLTSGLSAALYLGAATLLRQLINGSPSITRIRELLKYLIVVSAVSVANAILWALAWFLSGQLSRSSFLSVVLDNSLGTAIGTFSIASFFLFYRMSEPKRKQNQDASERKSILLAKSLLPRFLSWKALESLLQVGSVPLILWMIFSAGANDGFGLFYLFFLPILWIAARHGMQGMLPALLCMNVGVILVFQQFEAQGSPLKVQICLFILTTTGLYAGVLSGERAAIRDQLAEGTIYLNALVENNPLAIVVHGTDGTISLSNPAFQRMFGYSQTEIQGRKIDEFIRGPEGTGEETELTQRIVNGEPVHLTTTRFHRDGRALRVELYGVPLVVKDRLVGGIGIYKDISEQTRLEEELLLSQKLQAVGQLAGGVAHDFNNILGIIQGYSESMLERMSKENPFRESADEILNASKRATSLTRQLLAFGRKQMIQPQVLDLNTSVREMAKMLGRLIGEDVELVILHGSGLGKIKADPSQIEQIILNLAVNARDAMPSGGKLTIETGNVYLHELYAPTYAPVPAGRYAMLAVCDDGVGMSDETRAHIFDPFFTTKEKGKGTGLGLATVYGIVQQSGGHIRVDSELGKGSAFRIFFPKVEEEVASSREVSPGEAKILRGTETILLLEDEASFRKMTAEFLSRAGYSVLVASSASEATQIAQLHPNAIHMMLTDVIMPEINGPQLARFLSLLRPDMRVLFMSGYTDGALEQKDILAKDLAFIQKPFSWSSLALKIREVLEVAPVEEEAHKR